MNILMEFLNGAEMRVEQLLWASGWADKYEFYGTFQGGLTIKQKDRDEW